MTLNGMHTKSYPNGGVYEGEFQRGKMHGTGVYTCPNGDRCAWAWARPLPRRACARAHQRD